MRAALKQRRNSRQRERKAPRPLRWMLGVSILLHASFLFVALERKPLTDSDWIEVTPQQDLVLEAPLEGLAPEDSPETSDRRVVQSESAEAATPTPESRFLSDKDRSVALETRAARVDAFQQKKERSGSNGGSPPSDVSSAESQSGDVPSRKLSMKDLGIGGPTEWVGGLEAATDDKLEGVPVGERTALNTREFRYHSFYVRVKEQLRQSWKPEVERRAEKLFMAGTYPVGKELVTRVIVYLDASGRVMKVERVRSSGTTLIDEAADEAFRRVAVLPNPPQRMIDRDGLVRLHWEFIVQANETPELRVAKADEREPSNREFRDL